MNIRGTLQGGGRQGVFAVVLAGGRARRMGGGDKCRLVVGGRTVMERSLACLVGQVSGVVVSANGDLGRFGDLGVEVVGDGLPGQLGPLAGILAGLDWGAARGVAWVVSVPGDCPFLPGDLVARLMAGRQAAGAVFACAASGGRMHPVVGVWPVAGREGLRAALRAGVRKVGAYMDGHSTAVVEWPVVPRDPFFNINSPADLAEAEVLSGADG